MTTTEQSLFDTMVNGLASQGFVRSKDHDNCCVYRSPDGLKCAVGHLIPDDKYVLEMDHGIDYWLGDVMGVIGLAADFYDLLVETRFAHDTSIWPDQMKLKLRKIAAKFELQVPEVLND